MATKNVLSLDTRAIMRDVAKSANKSLAKELQLWARTANKNITRGAGLNELNRNVASKARSKIIDTYHERGVGARKSYRWNDRGKFRRYANGRMEKALNDPKTISADRTGIHFINIDRMDYWARQWYRLNFGTKGASSRRSPTSKPMTFFGVKTSAKVSLDSYEPSKAFRIPNGFFSMTFAAKTSGTKLRKPQGVGSDAFYAARKDKRQRAIPSKNTPYFKGRMSKGIKGQRFLDAGASYINAYYPKQFEKLARSWLENKR